MRKTPALLSAVAAAAVLTASLVGCSASASGDCTPSYHAGDASKIVKATASTAELSASPNRPWWPCTNLAGG